MDVAGGVDEVQGSTDQGSEKQREAGAGGLRDGALGKGQVLEEHIQAAVLLVEELLHPPAGHRAP